MSVEMKACPILYGALLASESPLRDTDKWCIRNKCQLWVQSYVCEVAFCEEHTEGDCGLMRRRN